MATETYVKHKIDRTYIDDKYNFLKTIDKKIKEISEIDMYFDTSLNIQNFIPKIFVLSIGSHFEKEVMCILKNIIKHSTTSSIVRHYIENNMINDKFFKLFNWDQKNTNHFIGKFGKEFSENIKECRKKDTDFFVGESNFQMFIGRRNIFAHEDIINATNESTLDDYYKQAVSAADTLDKIFEDLITHP